MGPDSVALLRADDPSWDGWLDQAPADIYHTSGFHRYAAGSGEGEPYLLVVGDRRRGLAWPYLLRPVAGVDGLEGETGTDVTSVYGYPGPVAWGHAAGDPFLRRALDAVRAVWRDQEVVAAFTRFNPLLENVSLVAGFETEPSPVGGAGPVVAGGSTVSIDLTLDDGDVDAPYARNVVVDIAAARRAGLVTTPDEQWTDLSTFVRLYLDTMARNRAADYYYFDQAHVERLRTDLDGRLHLLVTRLGDVPAAAGLFTEFRGIVETYLVGTSADLRYLSPYKVLVDDARRWARRRGGTVLHLGGGRGGREDSLFWFKSRFSPVRHAFHTGRWVLDRARYDRLVAAHLASLPEGVRLDEAFFPAYRAPILPAEAAAQPRRTSGDEGTG